MANIHISLAGEGRGHAARVKTLLESLGSHHSVTVYTFGDALQLLAPGLAETDFSLEELPGARFHYGRDGEVNLLRTACRNLGVLRSFPRAIDTLESKLRGTHADLVITDFEPLLPRAARRVGIPVVAVDHQSVLAHGDFRDLPAELRRHARWMGRFVRAWCGTPDVAISSSFYRPRRRHTADHVRFTGVLLRDAIRQACPTDEGHLLAYVRKGTPMGVLDALAASPREVRVYGSHGGSARGSLRPMKSSTNGFARDLASCHAVITSAGNQLVGEAIYLGKPVLAMPEPGNREQEINAWFLEDLGAGCVLKGSALDQAALLSFLEEVPSLAGRCGELDVDGTAEALWLVEAALARVTEPIGSLLHGQLLPSATATSGVQPVL